MRFVGNFLWIITGGIIGWLLWMAFWVLLFWTPYSKALLNLAELQLRPFGREVIKAKDYEVAKKYMKNEAGEENNSLNWKEALRSANTLWTSLWLVVGIPMFLLNVISGLLLFVTIIGAPFGIQAFKLAQLSLNPVGKKVVKTAVAKEVEAALARKALSN